MTGTSKCFNINLRNGAIMLSFARPDTYRD
jgi:hypothetical protein